MTARARVVGRPTAGDMVDAYACILHRAGDHFFNDDAGKYVAGVSLGSGFRHMTGTNFKVERDVDVLPLPTSAPWVDTRTEREKQGIVEAEV